MIRQPIVSVLGHVDHGKTTLLDRIRGSSVAKGEAGGITQHTGASEIPIAAIKKTCGPLLDKMKLDVTIPGLLFIDTPGHAAFSTLRRRGGAIADIVVLVIDVQEGIKPQTDESILFLKEFKTPFIIAANKIDRMLGWQANKGASFQETYKEQSERVQEELEKAVYTIVGQLGERGFDSERYDRISDFTKQISIVPVSGLTGEGVADLLMVLTGIAQRFLKNRIELTAGSGRGTVLEVKEHKGLGLTMDVILYDGEIRKGDYIVIGGQQTIVSKVKSLLKPEPLKDSRVERQFIHFDSVTAAAGVRISAPDIDKVIAGSPIIFLRRDSEIEKAEKEVAEEIEEIEIQTEAEGGIIKADTLGSLEALIKVFKDEGLKIRRAEVGSVMKQDVMEVKSMPEPLIFAFNVALSEDAASLAKDSGVEIFSSNIIYRLIEGYQKWKKSGKEREEKKLLDELPRPAQVKVIPGFVFRQSKPAVFGVEILVGTIRQKNRLDRKGKTVGEIKEIQKSGGSVKEAVAGDRVALSMDDITIGKQINEGDVLNVHLTPEGIRLLEKVMHKLRDDEKRLLKEILNG